MPPLTESEAADRAEDWMDALYEYVPHDRLEQMFRRAVHNHDSPFPVNSYEIIGEFNKFTAEQVLAAQPVGSPVFDQDAADCPFCFGNQVGLRFKFDAATGERLGMTKEKCDHQPKRQENEHLFNNTEGNDGQQN